MQNIRFSKVEGSNDKSKAEESGAETMKKKSSRKFLFSAALLVVVLASPFLAVYVKERLPFGRSDKVGESDYYAVFLDNDQIYFGKLASKSAEEIVLSDVYFLQVNSAANQDPNTQVALVKIGNELHGPTDEIFINMEHVTFYEKLREDSKVVESIKSQGAN